MPCLWCASRPKVPLACVWHKERFYTAGFVPCNGVGDIADGEPWISVVLSWNGFTILTHVIFPAFKLYKCTLMLLISWLLTLYPQSML